MPYTKGVEPQDSKFYLPEIYDDLKYDSKKDPVWEHLLPCYEILLRIVSTMS